MSSRSAGWLIYFPKWNHSNTRLFFILFNELVPLRTSQSVVLSCSFFKLPFKRRVISNVYDGWIYNTGKPKHNKCKSDFRIWIWLPSWLTDILTWKTLDRRHLFFVVAPATEMLVVWSHLALCPWARQSAHHPCLKVLVWLCAGYDPQGLKAHFDSHYFSLPQGNWIC